MYSLAIYDSITAGRDFHPAPKMNHIILFYSFTIKNYEVKVNSSAQKNPIKLLCFINRKGTPAMQECLSCFFLPSTMVKIVYSVPLALVNNPSNQTLPSFLAQHYLKVAVD